MKRREFVSLLGGATAARPLAAQAQTRATLSHLGYLWLGSADEEDSTKQGLRQGLRDLGYVEGRDIIIEYRYADGHEERLATLVGELVAAKVERHPVARQCRDPCCQAGDHDNSGRVDHRRPGRVRLYSKPRPAG